MPSPFTTPVAQSVPFEPNRNPQWGGNPGPSGIQSDNVQDAIEEAKADAIANDKFVLLASYGGNANSGRFLEAFSGQDTSIAPIWLVASSNLFAVTLQTTAASATCTVGLFDYMISTTVPVYTVVMSGVKRVQYSGTPLAVFSAGALLTVKVISGSINQPSMQITLSAST
jgi:hypothetical protein